MQYSLTLHDAATRALVTTLTKWAQDVVIADTHCRFTLRQAPASLLALLLSEQLYDVVAARGGIRYRYRTTRPTYSAGGLQIEAFAQPEQALRDVLYDALWSTQKTSVWEPITSNQLANYDAGKYETDTNNRLYLALRKNTVYNSSVAGGQTYAIPHRSSRTLTAIVFDFELTANAAGYIAQLKVTDEAFSASTTVFQYSSMAGTLTGHRTILLQNSERVYTSLEYSGSITYAGETGSTRFVLTNVRIVTGKDGLVATTIPFGVGAIGSQVVTPANMAGITVGSKLTIGNTGAEEVVVSAVTATTFTATFTTTHPLGVKVSGWNGVTAKEIAANVLSTANSVNSGQVATSTLMIQTPSTDIDEAEYRNMTALDVLADLAGRFGYTYGADLLGVAYILPAAMYARTWYVHVADLDIVRPSEDTYNSYAATYTDAAGRYRQTSRSTDTLARAALGVTRQAVTTADTTSESTAEQIRDTTLLDNKARKLQTRYQVRRLYTITGVVAQPDQVRRGDMLIAIDIPVFVTRTVAERTITVAEVLYYPETDTISIAPANPVPTVETLLAAG